MPRGAAYNARMAPAGPFDVLVRGSGAVGLAAALALSRQGLAVALAGPAEPPGGDDVRAYALNAASVALLRQLKVWDAIPADARTAVHEMRIEGDAPGAALAFSAWAQGASELAFIVDAAELERALRAAVRFAPHVAWLPSGAEAGAEPAAALQVLAEGRDSASRERLGVRMPRQAYGQRGIAARLLSDRPHGGLARQWFRSPDVLALLPLDRPPFGGRPGHGLGLVWSVPDERADALMALTDDAFVAELMAASGGAAGTLQLVSRRAQWPLVLAHAERVCGAGWVLVGDAAHLVHPLAGQGLNLGFGDVEALARVIAAREPWRPLGDLRLLQRYARERAGPVAAMARLTDGLLQLFASPLPWVRELRNRGLTLVDHLPPVKRLLTGGAAGG